MKRGELRPAFAKASAVAKAVADKSAGRQAQRDKFGENDDNGREMAPAETERVTLQEVTTEKEKLPKGIIYLTQSGSPASLRP